MRRVQKTSGRDVRSKVEPGDVVLILEDGFLGKRKAGNELLVIGVTQGVIFLLNQFSLFTDKWRPETISVTSIDKYRKIM